MSCGGRLVSVSAIVLAAGRSSRFDGGHKLLADTGNGPMMRQVLLAVSESPVSEIILVTAPEGGRIVAAAGPGRWRPVTNETPGEGISSSIQAGIAAASASTTGAVIVLADMPGISTALIASLIALFETKGGGAIVHPISEHGRQGHPVLWPRALFPDLMALTGDTGGKALLHAHRALVATLTVGGNAPFLDIDTAADLQIYRDGKS